jgi:hypothetical protein
MGQPRDDRNPVHRRDAGGEPEATRLEGDSPPPSSPAATAEAPSLAAPGIASARAARRAELKRRARGPDVVVTDAAWFTRSPRAAGVLAIVAVALVHGVVAWVVIDGRKFAAFALASAPALAVAAYPVYLGASIVANPGQRFLVRTQYGAERESFSRSIGACLLVVGLACDALGLALVARLAFGP